MSIGLIIPAVAFSVLLPVAGGGLAAYVATSNKKPPRPPHLKAPSSSSSSSKRSFLPFSKSREPPAPTRPEWLPSEGYNWAVVGAAGVGKSFLINTLRGKRPTDPGAAPVGVSETTIEARSYAFPPNPNFPEITFATLWDIPGGATQSFPAKTYIDQFGLRFMHGIILVVGGRITEFDGELIKYFYTNNIPYYVVRSMLDLSIMNNARDYGKTPEQTLSDIHAYIGQEIIKLGCQSAKSRTYVLSGLDQALGDFAAFEGRIVKDSIAAMQNPTDAV